MAHGTPDWGGATATSTVSAMLDMGELAARLDSINKYDRRGNVIFADGFELGLLGWGFDSTGSGAYYELSPASRRSGQWSAKVVPGNAAGNYAALFNELTFVGTPRIGIEAAFTLNVKTQYIEFGIAQNGGFNAPRGSVRLDIPNGKIQVLQAGWTYTEIASTPMLTIDPRFYNTLKLVIDFTTNKYVRVILNGQQTNTSLTILVQTGGQPPGYYLNEFDIYALDGSQPPMYLDDVIVTINEP